MLHDMGLSLRLWKKTCNTAIYLLNRSPHRIVGMITPKEAFSERNLDVSHFRIFGTIVYFHVSNDRGNKHESTIEMGVFIGYIESPHNYGVYFPLIKVTVVRRDVKFYQEKAMRCSLKRYLSISLEEEILATKEDPQVELQHVLEQPQVEEKIGDRVEAPTQLESSREGRNRTREVDILVQDE